MPLSRQPLPDFGPSIPPPEFAWHHIVLTTYGTWLPGDERGFRTRHHKQHVEGDYKSPPKESYTGLHAASASQMNCAPARIPNDCRPVLGLALVHRLQQLGGFPLTCAVLQSHVHLLVKLPTGEADSWMGLAKKHAWFEMREVGWQKMLWAKKGKVVRIRDQSHQCNCFAYIVKHLHQGAWVWVHEQISDDLIARILKSP